MDPEQLILALDSAGFDVLNLQKCKEILSILKSDGSESAQRALAIGDAALHEVIASIKTSTEAEMADIDSREEAKHNEEQKRRDEYYAKWNEQYAAEARVREEMEKEKKELHDKYYNVAVGRQDELIRTIPESFKKKPGWEKAIPNINEIIDALAKNKEVKLKDIDNLPSGLSVDQLTELATQRGQHERAPSQVIDKSRDTQTLVEEYEKKLRSKLEVFKFEYRPKHILSDEDRARGRHLTPLQEKENADDQLAQRQLKEDIIRVLVPKLNSLTQIGDRTNLGTLLYEQYKDEYERRGGRPLKLVDHSPIDKREESKKETLERQESVNKLIEELKEKLKVHPWGFETSTFMPRSVDEIKFGISNLKEIDRLVKLIDSLSSKKKNRMDRGEYAPGTSLFRIFSGAGAYFNEKGSGTKDPQYLEYAKKIRNIYNSSDAVFNVGSGSGSAELDTTISQNPFTEDDDSARHAIPDLATMMQSAERLESIVESDDYSGLADVLTGVDVNLTGRYQDGSKKKKGDVEKISSHLQNKIAEFVGIYDDNKVGKISWGFEHILPISSGKFQTQMMYMMTLAQAVADLNSLEPSQPELGNEVCQSLIDQFWDSSARKDLASEYGDLYSIENPPSLAAIITYIRSTAAERGASEQEPASDVINPGSSDDDDNASVHDDVLSMLGLTHGTKDDDKQLKDDAEVDTIKMNDVVKSSAPNNIVQESDVSGDINIYTEFTNDSMLNAYSNYDAFVSTSKLNARNDSTVNAKLKELESLRSKLVNASGTSATALPRWLPDILNGDARPVNPPRDDVFYFRNKKLVDEYAKAMGNYLSTSDALDKFIPAKRGEEIRNVKVHERGKYGSIPTVPVSGGDFLAVTQERKPKIMGVSEDGSLVDQYSQNNVGVYVVLMPDGGVFKDGNGEYVVFNSKEPEANKRDCVDFMKKTDAIKNAKPVTKTFEGMVVGKSTNNVDMYILRPAFDDRGRSVNVIESVSLASSKVEHSKSQPSQKKQAANVGEYVLVNGGRPQKITKIDGNKATVGEGTEQGVVDLGSPGIDVVPDATSPSSQQTQQPAQAQQPLGPAVSMNQVQQSQPQGTPPVQNPITMDEATSGIQTVPTAAGGPVMTNNGNNGSNQNPGPDFDTTTKGY